METTLWLLLVMVALLSGAFVGMAVAEQRMGRIVRGIRKAVEDIRAEVDRMTHADPLTEDELNRHIINDLIG